MTKKKIKLDSPIYLGFFILNYAKLHRLRFYYECLDYYVDRSDFEMGEMDTDSAYYAISQPKVIDVVKPDMKKEYLDKIQAHCHLDTIDADRLFWYPEHVVQIIKHMIVAPRACSKSRQKERI